MDIILISMLIGRGQKFMQKIYLDKLVSVIIPTYNCENFIEETVESVEHQTYKIYEIIIVDDASTDCTIDVVLRLQEKYGNIYYYQQPENQGVAVARNIGLELAKGRYVAFLDADDLWKPNKLEIQLLIMQKKECAFSYTAYGIIDESGRVIKKKCGVIEKVDYEFLLKNTIIGTSTVILDRNILGGIQMPLRRAAQDYAMWLKLLKTDIIAVGIDEILAYYRMRKSSISSNKWKSAAKVWRIQRQEERLSKRKVFFNVCCFCINAFKKYYL